MTEDLVVGRITYPLMERREWVFGTAPDPRDARIADLEAALQGAIDAGRGLNAICLEYGQHIVSSDARIAQLEAVLREVRKLATVNDNRSDWARLQDAGRVAGAALVPPPERDMSITHEELPA